MELSAFAAPIALILEFRGISIRASRCSPALGGAAEHRQASGGGANPTVTPVSQLPAKQVTGKCSVHSASTSARTLFQAFIDHTSVSRAGNGALRRLALVFSAVGLPSSRESQDDVIRLPQRRVTRIFDGCSCLIRYVTSVTYYRTGLWPYN